jgi:hypothetical protein
MVYMLRRRTGARPVTRVRYQVGEQFGIAEQGSLEHFLMERYRLDQHRGRSLWTVQVVHRPYPLHRAHVEALEDEGARVSRRSVSSATVPNCWSRDAVFGAGELMRGYGYIRAALRQCARCLWCCGQASPLVPRARCRNEHLLGRVSVRGRIVRTPVSV